MLPPKVRTYPLLRPLSWLYATVMQVRNNRFDNGKLPTESVARPIISVGNISVGGTGKTPMCAYLLGLLQHNGMAPALLSRGYGRKSKGYHIATPYSTAADVGDEPREIYRMFEGRIPVCVCEDRRKGARQLLTDMPKVHTIVLDDAYQHRYIHRDLNILLTDFHRLYTRDCVLPEGMLRERSSGANRADIIVVTKCPPMLSPSEAETIRCEIAPLPHQHVFFTSITYAPLTLQGKRTLLFTGIAKPEPLADHLRSQGAELDILRFADHHAFTPSDLDLIVKRSHEADLVVTTAKDYSRLPQQLIDALAPKLAVQHISVNFLFGQYKEFNHLIINAANGANIAT